MKIILYAFSLVYIATGVCMVLYTEETRNVFRKLVQMGFRVMSSRILATICSLVHRAFNSG